MHGSHRYAKCKAACLFPPPVVTLGMGRGSSFARLDSSYSVVPSNLSNPLTQQSCNVRHKDIRKFLDGKIRYMLDAMEMCNSLSLLSYVIEFMYALNHYSHPNGFTMF